MIYVATHNWCQLSSSMPYFISSIISHTPAKPNLIDEACHFQLYVQALLSIAAFLVACHARYKKLLTNLCCQHLSMVLAQLYQVQVFIPTPRCCYQVLQYLYSTSYSQLAARRWSDKLVASRTLFEGHETLSPSHTEIATLRCSTRQRILSTRK